VNYFARPEVSNSDLTSLKKYFLPTNVVIDLEKAYRFGSLLDAIITEPERVDFFKMTVDGVQYSRDEFEKAEQMKRAFQADPFCRNILENSVAQHVTIRHDFAIEYGGHRFFLNARAKWDFFGGRHPIDADLKSTVCTTEKSFIETLDRFDYDRQGAWYMDLEGRDRFMFLGVSKVNHKIFKFAIKRGDPVYQRGRAKYQEILSQAPTSR